MKRGTGPSDPPRSLCCRRHPRRRVGRGRAAVAVHGELGVRAPHPARDGQALEERRAHRRGDGAQAAVGQELPRRLDDAAPAQGNFPRVCVCVSRPKPGTRDSTHHSLLWATWRCTTPTSTPRRTTPSAASRRNECLLGVRGVASPPPQDCPPSVVGWRAHVGPPVAARGPLPLLFRAHLRGRLRGGLLLVQVGRGPLRRRLRRLRGGRPRGRERDRRARPPLRRDRHGARWVAARGGGLQALPRPRAHRGRALAPLGPRLIAGAPPAADGPASLALGTALR